MPIMPPGRQTRIISRGRGRLIRREHGAEGRDNSIKRRGLEGQALHVRHLPGDIQAFRLGSRTAAHQQRIDIVGGSHLAPATGKGERRIAVAGRDVKHPGTGRQVHRLGQILARCLQGDPDAGIVARGPGGVLFRLDRGIIGGGLKCVGHDLISLTLIRRQTLAGCPISARRGRGRLKAGGELP